MLEDKSDSNQKLDRIGFFAGVFGITFFLILTIISHYFAIKNGYDWTYWELSELVLYGFEAKILFMIGAIIGGICIFAILLPLGKYFEGKKIKITYYILACSISLLLVLVGAVAEDWFKWAHYVIGVLFFIVDGVLILFSAIYLFYHLPEISKFYPFFGFASFIILVFHTATRFWFGMAYTQRLAILFSIIYIILIGERLLLRGIEEGSK